MRLAAKRDELSVIADQFGAPTSAALLADVTAQVIAQTIWRKPTDIPSGVFHVTASGETSWHGFAQAILRGCAARHFTLQLKPEAVRAIPASDYPLPAPRPFNSRLKTARFQQTFHLTLPHWQAGLDHVLDQLILDQPTDKTS
jgi:dTDP-4-dehydrorhamnose reductase